MSIFILNEISRFTSKSPNRARSQFEWIGFAFGLLRGEDTVAGMAEPALDDFVFLVALPFARDAGTMAVEAAFLVFADEVR